MTASNKIVIIDDEAPIRMLLEQTLEDFEDEGVDLLFAENGKEGLDLVLQENPKLVFCDVMMPIMNGYEVCEQIKKASSLSGIYFVLLTAKGQEADKKKGEAVGADLYMTKPFDPDRVIEIAERILGIQI